MSFDGKDFPQPKPESVSVETKFAVLKAALAYASAHPGIILTGSVSQIVEEKKQGGVCEIVPADLVRVNDIDLAKTNFKKVPEEDALVAVAQRSGFDMEITPLELDSAYEAEMFSKAFGRVIVKTGEDEMMVTYTKPAFLLLALVRQDISEKTPAEKYARKLSYIQAMKGFSEDDFKVMARFEIARFHTMNEDTFIRWQRIFRDTRRLWNVDYSEMVERELDHGLLPSTVDRNKLGMMIAEPENFDGVTYDQVKKPTEWETFLAGMETSAE